MATATMATAAGAAALLYYTLNRRLQAANSPADEEDARPLVSPSGRSRTPLRPTRAPATWMEAISTLSETLRFTYSETLGKWPIGDLAFGITFLLKRQAGKFASCQYICWQRQHTTYRSSNHCRTKISFEFVDSMLAFLKEAICIIFGGNWLHYGGCPTSGT